MVDAGVTINTLIFLLFSTTHFVLTRVNEQQEYQTNTILNLKKNETAMEKKIETVMEKSKSSRKGMPPCSKSKSVLKMFEYIFQRNDDSLSIQIEKLFS